MLILPKKNCFSDEVHFDLGGYVNEQNFRIKVSEKPYVVLQKLMQRSEGAIGPCFFENGDGAIITVIGDINDTGVNDIWLQQISATCHNRFIYRQTFDICLISQNCF